MNERELVKRSQKGDRLAFEELIRQFYPYVSHFLLRITENETLTEDLTQDTFLKMIRNIEKFDLNSTAGFGTWLITIAKRLYIDYLRTERRIMIEDIEQAEHFWEEDFSAGIFTHMEYEEVIRAMEMLPPEQAIAIRLKYEEGMTLEKIAQQFGVPPKTIKSRIHDGKKKLQKFFSRKEKE